MFEAKPRCPFCAMNTDTTIDRDHYLTCTFTRIFKNDRLIPITLHLDKVHTPPFLCDNIVHSINRYYNNGLVDELPAYNPIPFNHQEIIHCTHLQEHIDWGHFLRGKISKSFHSPLNSYFRSNHLGKRSTSHFWSRSLIPFLWDLHHQAWLTYCNQIYSPDKTIHTITTAKSTLLHPVEKYMMEATILPKHKRLFFACKKLKYHSWNITQLQNWLNSSRSILRRYRDRTTLHKCTTTPVSTSQLNHPTSHPYQHNVHLPPNNNHFKVSVITRFYSKTDITITPKHIDLNL